MTTTVLVFAIAFVAVLWQRDAARRMVAAIYAVVVCAYDLGCGPLPGEYCYLSGAALDLIIIFAVGSVRPVTGLALQLQQISIVSMAINLIGFHFWFSRLGPGVYNHTYQGVYCAAVWALLSGEGVHGVASLGRELRGLLCGFGGRLATVPHNPRREKITGDKPCKM